MDANTLDNVNNSSQITDQIKHLEAVATYLAFKKDKDLQNWLTSFSNERFKQNLDAFKQYDQNLYAQICSYKHKGTWELFCNTDGVANLFFKEREEFLYNTSNSIEYCVEQVEQFVNSSKSLKINNKQEYDPFGQLSFKYNNAIKAAQLSFKGSDPTLIERQSVPLLFVNGIGLGYAIAEILARAEVLNVFLVEPDLELFYASLYVFDWVSFLDFVTSNQLGCRFVLGDKTDHILLYLRHFFAHNGFFFAVGIQFFNHYQNNATAQIFKSVMSTLPNLLHLGFTDDSIFGICHTCSNLLAGKSFVINSDLPAAYARLPVFVIGSGPSLDHDIPFLRKFQDKAIIIACGTSIDALYHAGIKPDFYANTERIPGIRQTLEIIPDRSFFDDIILLCTNVCHPTCASFFKHSAIFSKENEVQIDHIAHFYPKLRQIAKINGINPLVGNMGVAGALHLGFKRIFFFGLDNGRKTGSKEIHSEFTAIYNKAGLYTGGPNYATPNTAPANFGGMVETNSLFLESAMRIGALIKLFWDKKIKIECFNCSDGIKINNTLPISSQDLEAEFSKLKDIPKDKFHEYMIKDKTKAFTFSEQDIKKMFNEDVFESLCKEIQALLSKTFTNRIEVVQQIKEISQRLADLQLSADKTVYGQALDGSLQTMFCHLLAILYADKDENLCLSKAKNIIEIIQDFLTEIPEIFSKIPFYILGDHRKFHPSGKVGKDMPHCAAPNLPQYTEFVIKEFDDPQHTFEKKYE